MAIVVENKMHWHDAATPMRSFNSYSQGANDKTIVLMHDELGTYVGQFMGIDADAHAHRYCQMLRICKGVSNQTLSDMRVRLSEM